MASGPSYFWFLLWPLRNLRWANLLAILLLLFLGLLALLSVSTVRSFRGQRTQPWIIALAAGTIVASGTLFAAAASLPRCSTTFTSAALACGFVACVCAATCVIAMLRLRSDRSWLREHASWVLAGAVGMMLLAYHGVGAIYVFDSCGSWIDEIHRELF